ncbi:hypothetical protein SVAN01_06046 [Stagonosporopsis vannaccii]|nr:hypothetical protein SVAN01_06046 [Stagonosporopsis vannaccii]
MTYWDDHKVEVFTWIIVSVLLPGVDIWCFCEPLPTNVRTKSAAQHHHHVHPAVADIKLKPLPRGFVPAPPYSHHKRGLWVPRDTKLEKRADGDYCIKYQDGRRHEQWFVGAVGTMLHISHCLLAPRARYSVEVMPHIDTILYIAILYSVLVAVPFLSFVLHLIFKTSERQKEAIFQEEMRMRAKVLVSEQKQGVKSQVTPEPDC